MSPWYIFWYLHKHYQHIHTDTRISVTKQNSVISYGAAMDILLINFAFFSLRWRHNGRDGVSSHQPQDCLLKRLFRRRSKKTSKLRVTDQCAGYSPGTGEFPIQMASNAENISIWWRHHEFAFFFLAFPPGPYLYGNLKFNICIWSVYLAYLKIIFQIHCLICCFPLASIYKENEMKVITTFVWWDCIGVFYLKDCLNSGFHFIFFVFALEQYVFDLSWLFHYLY